MSWRAKKFGQQPEQAAKLFMFVLDRFKALKASDPSRKCKKRKHKEATGGSTWHEGQIWGHNRVKFLALPKRIIGRF